MTLDIEAIKADLVEAQSHTAYYAKTLIALRDTLLGITDDLEDEGDRIYFGSTNDADRLKDITGRIDDLAWEEIMADSHPPLNLYDAIERGNDERAAVETELSEAKSRAVIAEAREAELIAQNAALREALERIRTATPGNTNSKWAEQAFSWTAAVAGCALDDLSPPTEGVKDET